MKLSETSGVATIFGPPRQQLVWAPDQGVTATTSSWQAPSAPRAPSRSQGPRYATVRNTMSIALSFNYNIQFIG